MKTQHTIIFFDIRNFSEHRSRLATRKCASILTKFVKDIMDTAVELLEGRRGEFDLTPEPILNHTGDGFVLILRSAKNPLLGLLWISQFRELVFLKIKRYEDQIRGLFQSNPPKKLGFGIGAHYGLALPFRFKSFGNSSEREGFVGSAINVASRVEQCTKDHVCNVLVTKSLLKAVKNIIPKRHQNDFDPYWGCLGKHYLRGFDVARTLYNFKPKFHKAWNRLSAQNM